MLKGLDFGFLSIWDAFTSAPKIKGFSILLTESRNLATRQIRPLDKGGFKLKDSKKLSNTRHHGLQTPSEEIAFTALQIHPVE